MNEMMTDKNPSSKSTQNNADNLVSSDEGRVRVIANSLRQLGKRILLQVSKYIPFSQEYRKLYTLALLRKSKRRLQAFQEIKSFDSVIKERFMTRIRWSQIILSDVDLKEDMFDDSVTPILGICFITIFIGMPLYVADLFSVEFSILSNIGIMFLNLIYCYILLFLSVWLFLLPQKWQDFFGTTVTFLWLFTTMVGYLLLAYQLLQRGYKNFFQYITLSSLLAVLISSIFLFAMAFAIGMLASRWRQKRYASYANYVIIDKLINALYIAEQDSKYWIYLSFRRRLMTHIETVALYFETKLPTQLQSNDKATDFWFRNSAIEIAAGFRSLKKWILTPKADTRENLVNRISHSLACVIDNKWDELYRTEPDQLSRSKISLLGIRPVLGSLLTGIVPLLLLFFIQNTSLAVKGTVADYLTIGTVVWSALSFMSILDPLYSDKISSLRNIVSLLLGINKNNQS